jgi:hypothetical protein
MIGKGLTCDELYNLVWSEPVARIAKNLGISDVGLAKRCRREAVPLPPRGYWARIAAGQTPIRPPLPPKQDLPPRASTQTKKKEPESDTESKNGAVSDRAATRHVRYKSRISRSDRLRPSTAVSTVGQECIHSASTGNLGNTTKNRGQNVMLWNSWLRFDQKSRDHTVSTTTFLDGDSAFVGQVS